MIQKILLFLFRDVPPSIQVTRRCRAVVGGSIASDIRDGETPNEDQDTVFHSSERIGRARRGVKSEIKFERCPPSHELACSVWLGFGGGVLDPVAEWRVATPGVDSLSRDRRGATAARGTSRSCAPPGSRGIDVAPLSPDGSGSTPALRTSRGWRSGTSPEAGNALAGKPLVTPGASVQARYGMEIFMVGMAYPYTERLSAPTGEIERKLA